MVDQKEDEGRGYCTTHRIYYLKSVLLNGFRLEKECPACKNGVNYGPYNFNRERYDISEYGGAIEDY